MTLLERCLEDPVRRARIKRAFIASLVLVAGLELVLPLVFHGDHAHFAFERLPCWGSLYGFVSCVAIIVASKFVGKAWLMRREDHYER